MKNSVRYTYCTKDIQSHRYVTVMWYGIKCIGTRVRLLRCPKHCANSDVLRKYPDPTNIGLSEAKPSTVGKLITLTFRNYELRWLDI